MTPAALELKTLGLWLLSGLFHRGAAAFALAGVLALAAVVAGAATAGTLA